MDNDSKIFFHYLSSAPSHHLKFLEKIDTIIVEDPSLPPSFCAEVAQNILSNMEASFVERRDLPFFRFLLKCLCNVKTTEKKSISCTTKHLLHLSHDILAPAQF